MNLLRTGEKPDMICSLERFFPFHSGEGIVGEQGWRQQDLLEAVAVIQGKR